MNSISNVLPMMSIFPSKRWIWSSIHNNSRIYWISSNFKTIAFSTVMNAKALNKRNGIQFIDRCREYRDLQMQLELGVTELTMEQQQRLQVKYRWGMTFSVVVFNLPTDSWVQAGRFQFGLYPPQHRIGIASELFCRSFGSVEKMAKLVEIETSFARQSRYSRTECAVEEPFSSILPSQIIGKHRFRHQRSAMATPSWAM